MVGSPTEGTNKMDFGSMKTFPQASSLYGLECTKKKTSARRPDQESLAHLGMCRRVETLSFLYYYLII